MSSSNRVRLSLVSEVTLGTTPVTPRMRTIRTTGESLTYTPTFIQTAEIRSDRQVIDPIESISSAAGGINFELSYPDDASPLSEIYKSAFYNPWVNTATRFNDGTAASVITGVTTSGTVATCLTGTAFVASHLVQFSGFNVAGNNGVFTCTTGSATVPAFVGSGITDEASPLATAKMKVVGAVGGTTDITATATGLGSGTLSFSTLGLAVGQWIKVGGTASGTKFATAVLNTWIRVTAIATHALTCDNLPAGWTTDAGTGQTIKLFWGDQIRNGTTQSSLTIEKSFLGQTAPTHLVYNGMVVNTLTQTITSKAAVVGTVAFMGMGGSESTTPLDAGTYDAATTGKVMSANANVGRLAENGSALTSPNWASSFEVSVANNAMALEAVDSMSPVSIEGMECAVTGKVTTYFGDDTLLAKFYAGTATSFSSRITKNSQAIIYTLPRCTYTGGGQPQATGKNVQVQLALDITCSADDALTKSQILLDRVPYFEV